MPALMEFHEKYKDHRDKFQILAFHSASAPNFEMLDKKMESIIKKVWKGKDIPFPSLLDATGKTLRNFSVVSLGTHTLIDPDGNVVKGHAEATIAAAIEEWIKKDKERAGNDEAGKENTGEPQEAGEAPRKGPKKAPIGATKKQGRLDP